MDAGEVIEASRAETMSARDLHADCTRGVMPYSAGITDPIGLVLAYVPVALALLAMVVAIVPSAILLTLELLAWRSGRRSRHVPASL